MAIRINKILSELNIELETLESMFNALGYKEHNFTINSRIPDETADFMKRLCSKETEFLKLIEFAVEEGVYGNQNNIPSTLKIVGYIDLDTYNNPKYKEDIEIIQNEVFTPPSSLKYREKQSFWIDELAILSPESIVNSIAVGSFNEIERSPLYSVLIGTNGVGKSSLMKEIVDFFIDLHTYVNESESKLAFVNKGRLKGVVYHIDGVKCEVIRLKKGYWAKIDGQFRTLKDLRLPSIVACHFGAFEKFPTQKVNGSAQTKYDVPYYKYVGAHVNGNIISSSAIAFRLLFTLNEQMDNRQRQNICSILDFIGYDHKISLSYSLVMKSKKNEDVKAIISRRVEKDKEYINFSKQEKNEKVVQLYKFYKAQSSLGKARYDYDIDFDSENTSEGAFNELQYIYKLKQCDLVNSSNVIFHKQGCDITSDEMSSGEFAMLSTVLSISAAANDSHTLVLLDEPELSLHPNWQMTLIDNLDRSLSNKTCHLLIATHSHMLVSDLPMKRSSVTQLDKDEKGNLNATAISECTYGWSAEEVLLKVFKTATDRNRYFGERIGKLLENMGNNSIRPKEVADELKELQEISTHLSDIDPMKSILNTIVETYR